MAVIKVGVFVTGTMKMFFFERGIMSRKKSFFLITMNGVKVIFRLNLYKVLCEHYYCQSHGL